MQRILCALVALVTLLAANLKPSEAQTAVSQPAAAQPDCCKVGRDQETRPDGIVFPDSAHRKLPRGTIIVTKDRTYEDVAVRDHPLLLEGVVHGDVLAVHSDVTIAPTARVSGQVVVIDGTVDNEAGNAVRVVKQGHGVLLALSGFVMNPATNTGTVSTLPMAATHVQRDWMGGQLALLLFGLLCGFLAIVAAPRITDAVAERLSLDPARSLLTGGAATAALLLTNTVAAALMKTPARILWAPFDVALGLASLLLLAWGWVCGMRFAGEWVARKMGRASQSDSLYMQIAIGMAAFFFLNSFLGQIKPGLGALGMGIEFAIAIMGLGSLLLTRFGIHTDATR